MFIPQSHTVGYTLASNRWFDYYWKPVNKLRYRDEELQKEDFKDKKTLFVIGDSFVAGHGLKHVDERFSNILKKRLSHEYHVLNLGRLGNDTATELYRLIKFPIKPNVLIFQYFVNDIEGAATANGHTFKGFTAYSDVPYVFQFMTKNSYLINFIYWQFPRKDTEDYLAFLKKAYNNKFILNEHTRDLLHLVKYAQENKIPTYVVVIPFLHNTHESLEFTNFVEEFFFRFQIPTINVANLVEDIPVLKRVINKNDSHASVLVNQRIADKLYELLVEHKLFAPH